MLKRLLLIAVAVAVLLALLAYRQWRGEEVSISGTLEANEIRIGSLVGGRVQRVLAEEGQMVSPGEPLVELAPFDLLERKAEATENLRSVEAELARLKAGFRQEEIAQAKAQRDQLAARLQLLVAGPRSQEIIAAEARLTGSIAEQKLARSSFDRTQELFLKSATTQVRMDEVTEQLQAADALRIVREQELTILREGTRLEEIAEAKAKLAEAEALLDLRQTGYRKEEVDRALAAVGAAKAALDVIESQVAELTIESPVNGMVEALDLQPGDLVSPRAPVLSLTDREQLWFRTYIPLNRTDVQLDQQFQVEIDSFPGETFTGKVTFISRQAEFTPSNAQTPEDRQKQVFRVKVTMIAGQGKLRPGMTGEIVLGRE
jgi:multidrug resistance efflux pump